MALTFNEILQANDLTTKRVQVPQWGGEVLIRAMRASERAELEKLFSKKRPSDDPGGFRKVLLQATLVNEDGSRLLPDMDAAEQLMQRSAEAVETLFEAACDLNGFRDKDVEELEKN